MSEEKIAKAWGLGCTRSILLGGFIFAVIMGAFATLAILSMSLSAQNNQQLTFWSGGLLLFITVVTLGMFVMGIGSLRKRIQQVDDAFVPLGLDGKAFLWNGRQYHGILNGRRVDAYFYRGPSLDIYLASPLRTRLGVGLKTHFLPRLPHQQQLYELLVDEPAFSKLAIYTQDETWGRQILSNPEARAIILRLAAEQPGLEFRNLLFQPDAVQFQLYRLNPDTLSPDALRDWLADLFTLVKIAESLPAPQVAAVSSKLERKARLSRSEFTLRAVTITVLVVLLFAILFASGLYLLLYLLNGGL